MRKTRILFIYLIPSPIVVKEIQILRKHFDVKTVHFVLSKKNLMETFRTMSNMITGILWADATFSRFGNIHAFWGIRLSKIFRKKSIVVIGGFEVAKVPEIGYGAMLIPRSARIMRYVLNNADIVLTVDEGLKRDAIKNAGVIGDNILTVSNGYDYKIFKPKGEKENVILTVSLGDGWNTVQRKGLGTFLESAKLLPDMNFIIIGMRGEALEKLKNIAPQNVEFIGPQSKESLISFYQKAKVYCQLSKYEGHPNALCEAMLCECVPVGTDTPGVKTAIGDSGFYVPYGDAKATAEAINNAIKSDKGEYARERIKNMFPIERREKEFQRIILEELQEK